MAGAYEKVRAILPGIVESGAYVPEGFKVVRSTAIDAELHLLGAPNGVIDLQTGKLLEPRFGREALVARQLPDPYESRLQQLARLQVYNPVRSTQQVQLGINRRRACLLYTSPSPRD